MHKSTLINKISSKDATIGVIGLGYVGLPLAVEFAKKGFKSVGIDVDKRRVEKINSGCSYILDVQTEELSPLVKDGL
ncbi:MAG: hypothetical protein AMJ78_06255, partial [Omnitrophica WOR_2 bacterium SM23_29]